MRYSMLENGVDSLRGAVDALTKWDDIQEGGDHYLKDTIYRLNHGVEVLLKFILRSKAEYLIFTDLDAYMKAKKLVNEGTKTDVFDANHKLKTITSSDALERLQVLFQFEFADIFLDDFNYINKKRNQIEHFALEVSDQEKVILVAKLKRCLSNAVKFFTEHIPNFDEQLSNARYEYTVSQAEADYLDHQYDVWRESQL